METGRWAPRGWATEAGAAPWLADFGLIECANPGYPARTDANARDSDATLWFGIGDHAGFQATKRSCARHGKDFLIVADGTRPSEVIEQLTVHQVQVLNIAGNRESKNPGIGARVEAFLTRVFTKILDP
jgi:hypothetical protein